MRVGAGRSETGDRYPGRPLATTARPPVLRADRPVEAAPLDRDRNDGMTGRCGARGLGRSRPNSNELCEFLRLGGGEPWMTST